MGLFGRHGDGKRKKKPLISRRRVIESYIVTNRGSKHKITLSFNMSYMSKLPPTPSTDLLLSCSVDNLVALIKRIK